MSSDPNIWYRDKDKLSIGDVHRYTVQYSPADCDIHEIYYRLKNTERTPVRAVHLLNGPFILYSHVVPYNYDYNKQFNPEAESNSEVVFAHQIKPNQSFNVKLYLNENSRVSDNLYQWEIDIVSQIVITKNTVVGYDVLFGDDLQKMKRLNGGPGLHTLTNLIGDNKNTKFDYEYGKSTNPRLVVSKKTTKDIWGNEPKRPDDPVHLVIITHGIFSNVTADMLYLKDTLEKRVDENLLIRGYQGNAAKTEKGVKRLGMGVGSYVMGIIDDDKGKKINKISFIGHSLGGLVQLYALKYVLLTKGEDYFEKYGIQPVNLICMASPLLGILTEMSFLISWFLDLGTLGKTGRDLTLSRKIPTFNDLKSKDPANHRKDRFKPLLETLPDEPLQGLLKKFENLTLYANAVNDGIVPLRTSALLYLDWKALGNVKDLKKHRQIKTTEDDIKPGSSNMSAGSIGEIPEENEIDEDSSTLVSDSTRNKKSHSLSDLYRELITSNFNGKSSKNDFQNRLTNRQKRFLRINAKGSDVNDEDEEDGDESETSEFEEEEEDVAGTKENEQISGFPIPPKANVVESALSALLCPIPSIDYILNPDTRNPVIFHDKYYRFENVPQSTDFDDKKPDLVKRVFNYNEWKLHKQVTIAKKYHTQELNWRKVLVNLPPDAHNNIVVRRRFVNGYGWGVVNHLCDNFTHKASSAFPQERQTNENGYMAGEKLSGKAKI